MIGDIEAFIKYFHGQRRRTQWLVDVMPPEKAEWRPWPGEPSPGEIICRIAAGHRMYATAFAHNYWEVDAYEQAATNWDSALEYFTENTEYALDLIRPLPNQALNQRRRRPDGQETSAWRFLMAMLDHEVSHRSQFSTYLMLLNVPRPRLGGVTIEVVRQELRGS
ncbi:MAG: DinB family protein [Chloroflexi bacterium]|nr:DinB family protein [Chloroflexota bacterium]